MKDIMNRIHDTLNPKIWDKNNNILPEVSDKLIDIVKEFTSNIEVQMNIADIHIVGSNASYNYTENSDLDVHIVTNFELYECDTTILQAYFNSAKTAFNKNYDISIRGIDVEVYVEDIGVSTISNGVYSLLNHRWIVFPKKLENIPEVDISKEVNSWTKKINNILTNINNNINSLNNINKLNNNYINIINNIINNLYVLRKNSLLVDGEYGKGNLIFKGLRDNGILDKLKDCLKQQKSKELTLESLISNPKSIRELFEHLEQLDF